MKRTLLFLAPVPVLLFASCKGAFSSIPALAKESHAQEGIDAKAIADTDMAKNLHITDPEARATLTADSIEKWAAFKKSFDTTEIALGGVPAVSPDTMKMLLDLIKSISSDKKSAPAAKEVK